MTSAVDREGGSLGPLWAARLYHLPWRVGRGPGWGTCTAAPCWASWAEVISAQAMGDLATRSLGPQFGVHASSCWALSGTLDLLPRLRGEDTGQ